jgi:hypothetical protein
MIASCTATSARVNALLCVDGDDHASDHQRTPRLAPRGDPGRFTRHCRSVDRIGAQLFPCGPSRDGVHPSRDQRRRAPADDDPARLIRRPTCDPVWPTPRERSHAARHAWRWAGRARPTTTPPHTDHTVARPASLDARVAARPAPPKPISRRTSSAVSGVSRPRGRWRLRRGERDPVAVGPAMLLAHAGHHAEPRSSAQSRPQLIASVLPPSTRRLAPVIGSRRRVGGSRFSCRLRRASWADAACRHPCRSRSSA